MVTAVGKPRLVLDLSCRRTDAGYVVVADRWQRVTDLRVSAEELARLAEFASEFLVHAVEVEGQQRGVARDLVELLGQCSPIPTTYAGGVRSMEDVLCVEELGRARLDITVGSALDIFGGKGVSYRDMVAFDKVRRGVSSTALTSAVPVSRLCRSCEDVRASKRE
jgi:phosphoribosylformimino-5-aminoimidazole carboxamide ribotide isomerase